MAACEIYYQTLVAVIWRFHRTGNIFEDPLWAAVFEDLPDSIRTLEQTTIKVAYLNELACRKILWGLPGPDEMPIFQAVCVNYENELCGRMRCDEGLCHRWTIRRLSYAVVAKATGAVC